MEPSRKLENIVHASNPADSQDYMPVCSNSVLANGKEESPLVPSLNDSICISFFQ